MRNCEKARVFSFLARESDRLPFSMSTSPLPFSEERKAAGEVGRAVKLAEPVNVPFRTG